jgi:hypothetical protein
MPLGILYQSRNRAIEIGAVMGVKGNPGENICKKGLFESGNN